MTTRDNPIERVTEQYREAGRLALERVRDTLDNSANWVEKGKSPVKALTDKTLKLNRITHNSTARLVRVQAEFVEGTVEAAAQRLQAAARADSLANLVSGQMDLMPATRDRIVTDARKTLDVLSDTRDDLRSLVRETVDALRANGSEVVADAAGKVEEAADSVRKSARKTTRKAAPRKTARKSATKKSTTSKTRRSPTTRARKTTH